MNSGRTPWQRRANLFLLLFVAGLIVACEQQEEPTETPLRPVRSMVIDGSGSADQQTFFGVSRSAQESRLSFKVSGTVNSIPVKVGDQIQAGTVIAGLDPSTYQLQLQQAQATVAQSSAASRNARAAYDRTRGLYANNNASLGDLDSARANSESASAQLRAARKSLQLAELNLSYTQLKVDVDCSVDSVAIELNENVSTSTEIARVNCSDEVEVEVAVPESVIGEFNNGRAAQVHFDAIPDKSYPASVIEVGVGASGVGATFPVTVLLQNRDEKVRSGLAASVSFITESNAPQRNFVVPLAALVKRNDGTYVYLIQSSGQSEKIGTVELQQVELGDLQRAGVRVLSGLEAGDRVVTAGVSFMRDGLQVSY